MQARYNWLGACRGCGFQASTLTPGAGTGIAGLEQLRRDNFEALLDRLEQIRPLRGAKLLEVGCAKGWFLAAAAERGAKAKGIEPELANVEIARAAGLSVEAGFFPADLADKGPYDLVVFNDVFEHLPSPAAAIKDVAALLSPGGLVAINLPSSHGTLYWIASIWTALGMNGPFERMWQKGFPSPHLSYFSPSNLSALVERHSGLKSVARFPLTSVTRRGLAERIASSHKGLVGTAMFAGIWALAFILPLLPADIHVGVFKKPG